MSGIYRKLKKLIGDKSNQLLSHYGFKRYLRNTGWMFFGQMFSLLASFFVGAWLARYLGPENYGILNYAFAFAGLFAFIASLGLDSILIRELVAHPEKRDELLGTTFRLKIIGGVISFFLVLIGISLFQISPFIKLLAILFSISFILQAINVISSYLGVEISR